MDRRGADRRGRGVHLPVIFAVLVCCGIAYQILVIAGALRLRRRVVPPDYTPPVSILKPVRGRDPAFYEAIRSHALQSYPAFEIVFGVADGRDTALTDIQRLREEFPQVSIRVIETANNAPNQKVGALELLAAEARHDVLLVNDGDILVPPDYLTRVIGPLADNNIGLVTCLYRGRGESMAARAEALGIATEFAPSVLVARLLSSSGFALGATMAFRRSELAAIGGFAAIREYLADDYQLGARIASLGRRVLISDLVVETGLGAGSWSDVWKHQLRWARTIRISRPAGYFGYGITHITFWCLAAVLAGYGAAAIAGLCVRLIAAAVVLREAAPLPFVPLRDLFGFAVWCAGVTGKTVVWRGVRYELLRDGRMRLPG